MPSHPKHIAIFGGSFNPPHRGHLQVLKYLQKQKAFDEIWVIPTAVHAFGKPLLPFATRKHLLTLLLKDLGPHEKISIKSFEQTLYRETKKPSRTMDTLRWIKTRFPQVKLTLILGSDLLSEIHRWKNIAGIRRLATLFFLPRKGFAAENRKLKQRPFLPEIYSSKIRQNLKDSKLSGLTPEVARFIVAKKLYLKF